LFPTASRKEICHPDPSAGGERSNHDSVFRGMNRSFPSSQKASMGRLLIINQEFTLRSFSVEVLKMT